MDLRLVYITAKDKAEARAIGRALVEEKLAACVNIVDKVSSIYRWKGTIEEGSEAILIAKTVEANVGKLMERVESLHSYECPCVIVLPVPGANRTYREWVLEECHPRNGK